MNETQISELKECLETLQGVFNLEYHNKNWLAQWANQNPKIFNEEVRNLINRALKIVGSSDKSTYT